MTERLHLDYKEIKQVNPKEKQSWICVGRTDADKKMAEDEMDGGHHQLDGHEFEQSLRVGDG